MTTITCPHCHNHIRLAVRKERRAPAPKLPLAGTGRMRLYHAVMAEISANEQIGKRR